MSDLRLYFFIILVGVGFEAHALPKPLPECYAVWLFHGRNFERGDDPEEALLEAQRVFDEYTRQMSEIGIDDLNLGLMQGRIESGMSLVGPEDSEASYLRQTLENSVSRLSANVWPRQVLARPCALVDAFIYFHDGTVVRLEAESIAIDYFSREFVGFDFQVDEGSLADPKE